MNLIASSHVFSPASLIALDAYWRAANYLSVGQICLDDNPLLRSPFSLVHKKPRLLTPGLNFIDVHWNRIMALRVKLVEHKHYIAEDGEDMSEIRNWQWKANS